MASHKPTAYIKPYDVPFHLRQGFESELLNIIEAGILEQCDTPTIWNTKAFPVQKISDPTKCRIIGDFHGLNNVLLKLYWQTESSKYLLGCFSSFVVFYQRSSSIKGCLPLKILFHNGHLPSMDVFHQNINKKK